MNEPPFQPTGKSQPRPPAEPSMTMDEALGFKMLFGAHTGKTLEWIAEREPSYVNWLVSVSDTIRSPRLKEAIGLVADAYAEQIEAAVRERSL